MEAEVYNKSGEIVSSMVLPKDIFGFSWNGDLVAQVVETMRANQRQNNAKVKNRAEVRGGGKKPWKQKGTGRARHGSRRSPIWVGGGVTHGPTAERVYGGKINKKMKTKALWTILSAKARDGEIILVDNIGVSDGKTKQAKSLLDAFSKNEKFGKISFKTGRRVFVLTPEKSDSVVRGFRNLQSSKVEEIRNISPLDAVLYKYILIVDPEKSLQKLTGKNK